MPNSTDGGGSPPFVQMASVTDSAAMWDEFRTERAATLARLPLPLDPASIVRYDGGGRATPAPTPADSNSPSPPAASSEGDARAELSGSSAGPSTGATPSSGDDGDGWANRYGKAVLALLGANLVVGVLLLVAALAMWVRGRKGRHRGVLLADPVPRSGAVLLKGGPVDG